MNLSIASEVEFGNDEAVSEFFDMNALTHNSIFTTLLESGEIISHMPMMIDPFDAEALQDFLLRHDQEHRQIANRLGLAAPQDLTELDLDDQKSFDTWMDEHDKHHALIFYAIGV